MTSTTKITEILKSAADQGKRVRATVRNGKWVR
jgi:hypothetical protein